ncbi:MAG: amidohydrolase family protein [Actinomycetota bacterium]|nr:amidohydrolase family protein [Actinomycetota bacterium]
MAGTLYRRGRVRSADARATAVLVDRGLFAWIGSDEAADQLSPQVVVDLDGGWLAPAFVDAHVHATSTGLALTGLDLTDVPSLAVVLDRVERAARAARGGPVIGTGWDETAWPEARPPTAAELDRASYGGAVYLSRTDVHSAVVSSALLSLAGRAQSLPGYLGEGLVRQDAHHVLRRAAYESLRPRERAAAQSAMLRRAAELGIGCVHECGGPEIAGEEDFVLLLTRAEPGPDVIGYWGELHGIERARALGARGAAGDLFADGSLGSHTACLSSPYADVEAGSGTPPPYLDEHEVAAHVTACTRADVQAGFHAIGDGALAQVLAGFARSAEELGLDTMRGARHRVEHAEMVTGPQIAELARLGVVASVQPAFDARWGGPTGMYAKRLGPERALSMNPLNALESAGVRLAFGSDAPVTPLDPWGTIRAAVNHRTAGSGIGYGAAFAAHTRGGWEAAGPAVPANAGRVVVGAPATFAVWQGVTGGLTIDTELALPSLDLPDPLCLRTVVRGQEVFCR